MTHDINEPPGFATDIKPLFRESDRQSMRMHFDLWSHDDVSQHAEAIFARLREGTMPCEGSWPKRGSTSSNAGPKAESRNER